MRYALTSVSIYNKGNNRQLRRLASVEIEILYFIAAMCTISLLSKTVCFMVRYFLNDRTKV